MNIDFWFEFGSTYSYPAAMRIEDLAHAQGVGIEWKAFLLGAVFREQGLSDSPFNLYPAKGKYMWRDLERTCGALGIPFRRPSQFPRNGLLAARIACRFADAFWLPEFIRSVYTANFADDLDIADPEVIARCIDVVGQPAGEILAAAQSPESKDMLRRQTDTALGIGIFGAPTVIVGDEMFWGNDRLSEALAFATATPA